MSTILVTVGSLVIGVVATFVVGRYYFRRSVAKHLSCYVQFAAPVFAGMDPDVRKQLKIFYKDLEVDDLYELQFAVINDGERPIRDCLRPLTLHIKSDISVLDASILRVQPEGRTVDVVITSEPTGAARIEFPFLLLNKDEGFVAKIILRGKLTEADAALHIVAEDLPPIIAATPWFNFETPTRWAHLLGAVMFFALVLCSWFGFAMLVSRAPGTFPFGYVLSNGPWPPSSVFLWTWLVTMTVGSGFAGFFFSDAAPHRSNRRYPRIPPQFWQHHETYVSPYDMFFQPSDDDHRTTS